MHEAQLARLENWGRPHRARRVRAAPRRAAEDRPVRAQLHQSPPLSIERRARAVRPAHRDRSRAHRAMEAKRPRRVLRLLTAEIEDGMRALTVNSTDWDTMRVLDGVRRLYQPPSVTLEERVELARRFADAYQTLKDHPDVRALLDRVRVYLDRLQASGLSDRDLRRAVSARESFVRFMRHWVFAFVWLPLAMPGLTVFLPQGSRSACSPRASPREQTRYWDDEVRPRRAAVDRDFLAVPFYVTTQRCSRASAPPCSCCSGFASLKVLARTTASASIGVTFTRLLFLRRELEPFPRAARPLRKRRDPGCRLPTGPPPRLPAHYTGQRGPKTGLDM